MLQWEKLIFATEFFKTPVQELIVWFLSNWFLSFLKLISLKCIFELHYKQHQKYLVTDFRGIGSSQFDKIKIKLSYYSYCMLQWEKLIFATEFFKTPVQELIVWFLSNWFLSLWKLISLKCIFELHYKQYQKYLVTDFRGIGSSQFDKIKIKLSYYSYCMLQWEKLIFATEFFKTPVQEMIVWFLSNWFLSLWKLISLKCIFELHYKQYQKYLVRPKKKLLYWSNIKFSNRVGQVAFFFFFFFFYEWSIFYDDICYTCTHKPYPHNKMGLLNIFTFLLTYNCIFWGFPTLISMIMLLFLFFLLKKNK